MISASQFAMTNLRSSATFGSPLSILRIDHGNPLGDQTEEDCLLEYLLSPSLSCGACGEQAGMASGVAIGVGDSSAGADT